jgi:O-antigen ligase
MTENALVVWRENPRNLLVGVGIGGAGVAMHEAGLIEDAKEIVQNQYASLLLETGLVGVILIIVTGVGLICVILKRAQKDELTGVVPMVATLVVAYGVSLFFFAGLPNALHIYIMPVLLMVMYDKITLTNLRRKNGKRAKN